MKISVVIPTYNYGCLLLRAVASVINQADNDFEILIVDDGSTDDTPELVAPLIEAYPNVVHYTQQVNRGPAAARNRGIQISKGEYILFLDADDQLCPDVFPALRYFLIAHPSVEFVLGDHISVTDDGVEKYHTAGHLPVEREQRFKKYLSGNLSISPSCSVSHRKIFDHLSYPEELRATEDIPVFAQSLALFECARLDIPVARIHKHADSLRHQIKFVKDAGLNVVDAVFNPSILPKQFMVYRNKFLARRALSLFRSCYLSAKYEEADRFYRLAVRQDPALVTRWSYLTKYLKMKFQRT